jgi:primosomal protein N' (replication factor Y)
MGLVSRQNTITLAAGAVKSKPPAEPVSGDTVRVMLPVPVGNGYDYLYRGKYPPADGSLVEVPFGQRSLIGIVWGKGLGDVAASKLKSVYGVLDVLPLPEVSRTFTDWVANYTLTPPGLIAKMVLGGTFKPLKARDRVPVTAINPDHHQPQLSGSQRTAATELIAMVQAASFNTALLDGVTGSGKTEVYCEAVAEALRLGRQALILLPEIAMTAALIDRFTARFGERPIEWHSELPLRQRRLNWHAIASGKAKFVVGARSALFLPYPELGVIIVDEEHESAYKQEEGVIYHGRDMAVVRANLGNIPVVLASATPSLETMQNVEQGKYRHIKLQERFGKAIMPAIAAVDLRLEKMPVQSYLSDPVIKGLEQAVAQGQQAMLFLNRRGYAPLTLCRRCGHRLNCPNCTSWLIEHKATGRLQCHHCDYSSFLPKHCPSCQAEGSFAACGPGVERVAEEVKRRLPNIRFALMASDLIAGPKGAEDLVHQMNDHAIDLLIGTQIMAKGYHFPRLTFVGVVDADLGLSGGDPRAAERTFQLLQQVAGRAGRAQDPGHVLLQTTAPEHPVMKALIAGDRDAFYHAEMRERQIYRLPPFSRLASITVSSLDQKEALHTAEDIAAAAPINERLRVLGPAPPPFALLRGRHRMRLMVQADKSIALSAVIRDWLRQVKTARQAKVVVDIDPYSFL